MTTIDVYSQKELQDALSKGLRPHCKGNKIFNIYNQEVSAYDDTTIHAGGPESFVHAYGRSEIDAGLGCRVSANDESFVFCNSGMVDAFNRSHVKATGTCCVHAHVANHVEARQESVVYLFGDCSADGYDMATIVAYNRSRVRAFGMCKVVLYDQASVEAHESCLVIAHDNSRVDAHDYCHVFVDQYAYIAIHADHSSFGEITGGTQVKLPNCQTLDGWLEYHNVQVEDEVATLYKVVDEDYFADSLVGMQVVCRPGREPEILTNDKENGVEVHPSPGLAPFNCRKGSKIMAVHARLSDLERVALPGRDVMFVAKDLVGQCYEVDIEGEVVYE